MSDREFELEGWDDVEASAGAAASLAQTAARVDHERQAINEQALAEQIAAAVEAARPGLDKIPDPVEPEGHGDLTAEEKKRLDACIEGVELLTKAYWIAGKSLDTIATGRLFRKLPHKLEPERCYETIEEWADLEHGITTSRCSKLRAAWQLGEVLNARGYKAPEGQVREIVPVYNKHGLKAAIGLYEVVVQAVGADKVTAARLRETVKLLPGDLALDDDDDPDRIAKTLTGALGRAEARPAKPSTGLPERVKRGVDQRAITLADRLDRGRIPRNEVLIHLFEAFADDQDSRVFDIVLERMKKVGQ